MTRVDAAAQVMADQCLCFRARRVSRALTRRYDEALRPLGLQATQLTLLNAIALSGRAGGTMGAVADFLAMDPTTLSRNVRPLEQAGWVRVTRQAADGRVRMAVLTPAGGRMIEEARAIHAVLAGTVNETGPLRCEATAVGASTLLAAIVRQVAAAQGSKALVSAAQVEPGVAGR